MFKKYKIPFIISAFCLLTSALLLAAPTPTTETVTLAPTTGVGVYTASRDYVASKLVSIEIFNSSAATSTVTVARVRSGRTNTVAAVALTDGAGVHRETNTIYLFKGDVLNFANSTATGAVAEITFELLP